MIALVRIALRRPYTFVVLALLILIVGPLAVLRTPVDIFPDIRIPVVAVIWQYTGLPPDQMAGRMTTQFQRALTTTVNDIEHIEANSYNTLSITKVFFQPNVDIRIANTQITAPFTGVVVKKMAEVGESVAPIPPGVNISTASGAIVALADLDTLEVEADVAEANVARLHSDQPAEVAVEAFPDRRFRAVLRQVIPTADRTRATVQVKVTILDKDPGLKPEMNAKVNFLGRPRGAGETSASPPLPSTVTVPAESVVQRDGRTVVFEVDRGRARERDIVSDASVDGKVIVREGLRGGETLVARPPATMKDGDAVRVRG